MKKRYIAALALALAAFSFFACGKAANKQNNETTGPDVTANNTPAQSFESFEREFEFQPVKEPALFPLYDDMHVYFNLPEKWRVKDPAKYDSFITMEDNYDNGEYVQTEREHLKLYIPSYDKDAEFDELFHNHTEAARIDDYSDRKVSTYTTSKGNSCVLYLKETKSELFLTAYIEISDSTVIAMDFTTDSGSYDLCMSVADSAYLSDIGGYGSPLVFSYIAHINYDYSNGEYTYSESGSQKMYYVTLPSSFTTDCYGELWKWEKTDKGFEPHIICANSPVGSISVKLPEGLSLENYLTKEKKLDDWTVPTLTFITDEVNGTEYGYSDINHSGDEPYRIIFIKTPDNYVTRIFIQGFEKQDKEYISAIISTIK